MKLINYMHSRMRDTHLLTVSKQWSIASIGILVYRTASSSLLETDDLSSKYLQQPRPSTGVGPSSAIKGIY